MQVQSPSFRLLGPSSRPPKNFDLPMHCDVINFLTILLNFPSFFFSSLTLLRHSLYMPNVFIRVLDKMRGGDDKYYIPLPIGTGPLPPQPPTLLKPTQWEHLCSLTHSTHQTFLHQSSNVHFT